MSRSGASLFAWLQRAPFYESVHREAVALVPAGTGRRWLDVGCGPGLVTRLAAEHGYQAVGLDADEAMIRAARRTERPSCRFQLGGLEDLPSLPRADVVSATSLLCTVPDPRRALEQLWDAVSPGGTLLVLETTAEMTPTTARRAVRTGLVGRHPGLALWANVRQGRHVDPRLLDALPDASARRVPLLGGLLEAWVVGSPPPGA